MSMLRGLKPVFPPLADEQVVRLLRVLKAIAYTGLFASASFLIILQFSSHLPEQGTLVTIQRVVLTSVFGYCIFSLYMMWRGRMLRISGAMQIFSLWISLALVPDLTGASLYVIAVNHIALAVCIGSLLGWSGTLLLGSLSLFYILFQESYGAAAQGIPPLLMLTAAQIHVIELALSAMMLSILLLVVILSQQRSEISRVTAMALELSTLSEKKLESIIESMADVMLVLDTDGSIVRANRAAFTVLGYTETELRGNTLKLLLAEADDAPVDMAEMLHQPTIQQVNRHLKSKSGQLIPVSLSSSPLSGDDGQPLGVILVAQDMTQLEEVRRQLQQSYARFNQATRFSRIGVFEFDPTTRRFLVDDTMRQTIAASGMGAFETYEEFLSHTVEADRPAIREALDGYLRGERAWIEVEFRIKTIRGPRWVMVRGSVHAGGPNLLGTFMDVTRRKRAEMELARRDDMLRAITASSEVFLRSGDWQAQIPTLLREIGMAAKVSRVYILTNHADRSGREYCVQEHEWVADDARPEIDNPELAHLYWDTNDLGEVYRLMRRREPVHRVVSAIEDEGLRVFLERQDILSIALMPVFVQEIWWGVIGFDDCQAERHWSEAEIDALQLAAASLGAAIHRQRVERSMRENRDFLMNIVDNLGQGVMVLNKNAEILFVNTAISKIFGISPDRLIGASPDNFVDPEFAAILAQNRTQRQLGKTTSYPSRVINVDGTKTDVFVTGVPRYVDGELDGSYSLLTDISESRRIEAAQRQLSTEREQMRIMSDFVRDASHDFRTPLSIIQTSLYLLRRKAESPEQLERLNNIGGQASRLSRLIDGLLTMLELDRADLTFVPINLRVVAMNCVDRSREAANKAGLALELTPQEDICFVNGEEGYLMKAVANLVDNAIAFTAAGGRISVSIQCDETIVTLAVTDTGIGIAPEEQMRIFERLYKVDKARTIDSGGLGMGLSITKRIAELHGGHVTVTSAPGSGSTFCLSLPRVKPPQPRVRGFPTPSPITEDVKM